MRSRFFALMILCLAANSFGQNLTIENKTCWPVNIHLNAHDCSTSCGPTTGLTANPFGITSGNTVFFTDVTSVNDASCSGTGPGWVGGACASIGCPAWDWDYITVEINSTWVVNMNNPFTSCFGGANATSRAGTCGLGPVTFQLSWGHTAGGYVIEVWQ